jgi:hypothetical protein
MNRIVPEFWNINGLTLEEARVGVYVSEIEEAFVQFDVTTTTTLNWYRAARVLSSSWTDITIEPHNYFSIEGDPVPGRTWYINRNYGGCPNDRGWLMVDRPPDPCTFEIDALPAISIHYAAALTVQNYQTGAFAEAEAFAVFVR